MTMHKRYRTYVAPSANTTFTIEMRVPTDMVEPVKNHMRRVARELLAYLRALNLGNDMVLYSYDYFAGHTDLHLNDTLKEEFLGVTG